MNCCDYNCNQGRNCPARKTPSCPIETSHAHLDVDALPELSNWGHICYWVALGVAMACTLVVAAGAMGWAYTKWVA